MARDGLLFSFLAQISERKSPVTSTVTAGVMSGKMEAERREETDAVTKMVYREAISRSHRENECNLFVLQLINVPI